MFSSLRQWLRSEKPTQTKPTHRLHIEELEARVVPAISVTPNVSLSANFFVEQGGNNETNGGTVTGNGVNTTSGATNSILINPFNPNIAFVGTVAGGIWRSMNFSAASDQVRWEKISDELPTLFITEMTFDPNDRSNNTIYAGTGSNSSNGTRFENTYSLGVLRLTNVNAASTASIGVELLNNGLPKLRVEAVTVAQRNPNVILVAMQDGLFRSVDRGASFQELTGNGLPTNVGLVTDALTDPNRPQTFYVAMPNDGSGSGAGIFRSDDGGSSWIRIDSNTPGITRPIFGLGNTRVLMAFADQGSTGVLYVANLSGGQLSSIFRYEEDGLDGNRDGVIDDPIETAWFQMGTPPQVNAGGQGELHFSLAADTRNKNILYIAGDAGGAVQGLGNVARGTFTGAVNGVPTFDTATWAALLPGNTAPHPDSRDMAIVTPVDPTQPISLIQVDDGGVYRLVNPAAPNGAGAQRWLSLNTNLAVFEYYSGAYDTRRNLVLAGAQDNDSQVQTARNSPVFTSVQAGDGAEQEYSVPGDIRYSLGNNFAILRRFLNGSLTVGTQLRLQAPGSTTLFSGLETASGGGSDSTYVGGFQGTFPIAANRFAAMNVTLARRALYESTNMGDNITTVIPAAGIAGEKFGFDTFTTIVYGGMRNLVPLPQIIYGGTGFGRLYLRDVDSSGTGTRVFDLTPALNAAIPASAAIDSVLDVVIDPADYRRVYVLKGTRILFSSNAGATFTEITSNLGALTIQPKALALISNDSTNPTANRVLVVGGLGGVFAKLIPATGPDNSPFSEFGGTFPNALVVDLDFYPDVDQDLNLANGKGVLLATTSGRGTFLLSNAENFTIPVTINVTGNDANNTMRLYDNPASPGSVIIEDGIGNSVTVDKFRIQAVTFSALGGDDTIILGGTSLAANGNLSYVNFPITVDGGTGINSLQLNDSIRTTPSTVTVGANSVNQGAGDNFLAAGGSIVFANIAGLGLRTGLGNDTVRFDSSASAINFNLDGGGGSNTLTGPALAVNNWAINGGINGTLNSNTIFANFDNLVGGAGTDIATYFGTVADDTIFLNLTTAAFSGIYTGLAARTNRFSSFEQANLDAGAGVNNFTIIDSTGVIHGTMTNPASGLNVAPSGPTSASFFSVGTSLPTVNFTNINGTFLILGDDGSGQPDVIQVLGTSTAGLAGAGSNGEATSPNGKDFITATDRLVSIQNTALGQLLNVNLGFNGSTPTFSGIYVRTGFERRNSGDVITATTSTTTNLVIDGGTGDDQLNIIATGATTAANVNDPVLGPPQIRVTGEDGGSLGYLNLTSVTGLVGGAAPSTSIIVISTDAGSQPLVQVVDAAGNVITQFLAYSADFFGGVKVALGDVNGDGKKDIITGTGAGSSPHVKVFDGVTFQELFSFFAYEPNVLSGVNVAAGDVNGDGFADIITGVAVGLPSHVRAFSGADGSELKSFFAYDPRLLTGVSVASGDFNGDGLDDIVTGAGPGGGPHVKVFDSATNNEIRSFFAFDPGFLGGVLVATGRFNADGVPDIVVSPAIASVPFVSVIDGATSQPILSFFVNQIFAPNSFSSTPVQSGVRVATTEINGDGFSDIIVGKGGVGELPRVFLYSGNPFAPINDFLAFDGTIAGGLFVAGG